MIIFEDLKIRQLEEFLSFARPEDLKEIELVCGGDIREQSIAQLVNAKAIVQVQQGEPDRLLGIGGIEVIEGLASPWLVLTQYVYYHPVEFLRFSKRYLKKLLQTFPAIFNTAHFSNTLHVKWLEWLGCEWVEHQGDLRLFVFRRREEDS